MSFAARCTGPWQRLGQRTAAGSAICFGLTRLALPLRRDADEEREGLDLSDHGERAYNP